MSNDVLMVAGIVLLVPAIWVVVSYNRFVTLRQQLTSSWAGIDIELKRRHELIPNLVEVVRGYAQHERDTFERVVTLRNNAVAASEPTAIAARESEMMRAVKGLFVVAEAYPDLKADRRYADLQGELANTEDRIAAARRFYNGNVRDWLVLRDSFPSTIVAGTFGFRSQDPGYFNLDSDAEAVVPRIEALLSPHRLTP